MMNISKQVKLAQDFLKLHNPKDSLLLPNAWDVSSAILFEQAGFKAIASTSAGVAFVDGFPDGQEIPVENIFSIIQKITNKLNIPFSVDLESGFGNSIDLVLSNIKKVISSGAVGINLEDSVPGLSTELVNISYQQELIQEIYKLKKQTKIPFVINARTDILWLKKVTNERLKDVVYNCNSYFNCGADCVFVPGNLNINHIEYLTQNIDGHLNILMTPESPSIEKIRNMDVSRVTIGSFLVREVIGYTNHLINTIKDDFNLSNIEKYSSPYKDINNLFKLRNAKF